MSMADKKKMGTGRVLGYVGVGLIILAMLTGADGLGGLGLLALIIGVVVAIVEGRRDARA